MTVSAFFDESGKHNDHEIVSFGGVCSFNQEFVEFSREWERLLRINGIRVLSAKKALNPKIPLSIKNPSLGLDNRIQTLAPFIKCIRKHLQVVTGTAVDVKAFKKLPSHYFQMFGEDPIFTAFLRSLMRVVSFTPDKDKIVVVCDDEETTAEIFLKLYRRVRKVWSTAKTQLVAISFADDDYLFGLQASDLIASMMRLEIRRKLVRMPYDYQPLFSVLSNPPEKHERVWDLSIATGDEDTMRTLAEDLKVEYGKALKISHREDQLRQAKGKGK